MNSVVGKRPPLYIGCWAEWTTEQVRFTADNLKNGGGEIRFVRLALLKLLSNGTIYIFKNLIHAGWNDSIDSVRDDSVKILQAKASLTFVRDWFVRLGYIFSAGNALMASAAAERDVIYEPRQTGIHIYLFFALVWRFDCIKRSSACLISFSPPLDDDITRTCLIVLALHLIFGSSSKFLYLFVPGIVRAHSDSLIRRPTDKHFSLWEKKVFLYEAVIQNVYNNTTILFVYYMTMWWEMKCLAFRAGVAYTCEKHLDLCNQFLQHANYFSRFRPLALLKLNDLNRLGSRILNIFV